MNRRGFFNQAAFLGVAVVGGFTDEARAEESLGRRESSLLSITEIEFPSEGAALRGLLYLTEARSRKPPVIIMAHGTSATIYMVADKYAEAFCRAGFAVLLYDHRNFGRSGGEPRQQINP